MYISSVAALEGPAAEFDSVQLLRIAAARALFRCLCLYFCRSLSHWHALFWTPCALFCNELVRLPE